MERRVISTKAEISGKGVARVEALDLLRLIAALTVVLFHYGFVSPMPLPQGMLHPAFPEIAAFAKYGYLGVPLFFVISGFVIAYSADGRNATTFAIARATRIYPAFFFCMTLTFLVTIAFGAPYLQTTGIQWAANVLILAPALHQPYLDSVYWTIVSELTFYGWVGVFMAAGLFKRRIDGVVLVWLGLSVLNETVLGSFALHKILLTQQSGFFAAGLLLYEIFKGRRDWKVRLLLGLAAVCAAWQGFLGAEDMQTRYGIAFDGWIAATICLAAIIVVALAVRVRRVPLPPGLILGIGGLTYPLYLLHQNIGFIAFKHLEHLAPAGILVGAIIIAMIVASWAIWKYVERPAQRLMKAALTRTVARLGWASEPRPVASPSISAT